MSDYLSLNETAEMFAVSTRTVRRWIDEGSVKAYRIGPRLIRIETDSISGVYDAVPAKLQARKYLTAKNVFSAKKRNQQDGWRKMDQRITQEVEMLTSMELELHESYAASEDTNGAV